MNNEIEILFVDDNLFDVELTMRAMKKGNVANHFVHLKDGVEALDFLFARGDYGHRNATDHPKVILLDLKMPRMNGIEVLREIKSNELTKKIPVVVLTSSTEDPDIQECYKLGCNSYVVKPVNFDSLTKVVQDLGFYWMMVNKTP